MYDYSIKEILEKLKNRLDENNQIVIQSTQGFCFIASCTFYEPVTNEIINKFISETNFNVPEEYREFLLLHNGASFFTYDYGGACYLNRLEEIIADKIYLPGDDFYCIGSYVDLGQIAINKKRVSQGRKDYMFLISDEIRDFQCDFKTWLDRMIVTNGMNYWEWSSKILQLS